jgi:hypothetical protein
MDPKALQDLDARFVWTRDGFDSWRLLDAKTGPLKGDCDDYAVTALWLMCGRSMARFWKALATGKAGLWLVNNSVTGNDHLMLHIPKLGWFDNTQSGRGAQPDTGVYRKRFRASVPLIALKMGLGKI